MGGWVVVCVSGPVPVLTMYRPNLVSHLFEIAYIHASLYSIHDPTTPLYPLVTT